MFLTQKKELARNLDVELSWYMPNKAEQERPVIYERILPGWLRTQVNGNYEEGWTLTLNSN